MCAGLPPPIPGDLVVAALAAAHADHLRRGRRGRRDLELDVLQVHAVVRELELDHLGKRLVLKNPYTRGDSPQVAVDTRQLFRAYSQKRKETL